MKNSLNKFIYLFFLYLNKIWFNIYYPIKFNILKNIFNKYINNSNIIVSLTSIPSRIENLHLVIKSILCQSLKPEKVILWISKEDFENLDCLPKSLLDLQKTNFEIKWCDDNLKPHKKYYYAFKEYKDKYIVTIDDDVFYRKNLIKNLMKYSIKFNNCIICTRAHKITFDKFHNNILPYNKWEYETKDFLNPSHMICATGVGGILYPPNLFDNEIFNKNAIKKYCLNTDDLWLKTMEIINDKKVVAK